MTTVEPCVSVENVAAHLGVARDPVYRRLLLPFYQYEPVGSIAVIEGEVRALEKESQGLLGEVLG